MRFGGSRTTILSRLRSPRSDSGSRRISARWQQYGNGFALETLEAVAAIRLPGHRLAMASSEPLTASRSGHGTVTRLASQSALYGLAGAIGKALALLTVPLLTRMLTPADYGLADLANTFAALFAMTVGFAGDIPAARLVGSASHDAERRSILSSYTWATFVTSIAAAFVLLRSRARSPAKYGDLHRVAAWWP